MNTKVREELESIRLSHNGLLTAADTVKFATDPSTELHKHFTWDDTQAAHQYRLEQARGLIRLVVKVLPQTGKTIRAYVSLVEDRGAKGGGYREITEVMANQRARNELLDQAMRAAADWRKQYEELEELRGVFAALDSVAA